MVGNFASMTMEVTHDGIIKLEASAKDERTSDSEKQIEGQEQMVAVNDRRDEGQSDSSSDEEMEEATEKEPKSFYDSDY